VSACTRPFSTTGTHSRGGVLFSSPSPALLTKPGNDRTADITAFTPAGAYYSGTTADYSARADAGE